jgi:hypothetical protein
MDHWSQTPGRRMQSPCLIVEIDLSPGSYKDSKLVTSSNLSISSMQIVLSNTQTTIEIYKALAKGCHNGVENSRIK